MPPIQRRLEKQGPINLMGLWESNSVPLNITTECYPSFYNPLPTKATFPVKKIALLKEGHHTLIMNANIFPRQ